MVMQMRGHVAIPGEATLDDIDAVREFLHGKGYPRVDIARRAIDYSWEVTTEDAPDPLRGAVLAALYAARDTFAVGDFDEEEMRPIVSAAMSVVEHVEEVNCELRSRGWHSMSVLAENEEVA